jgi:hypothetical protein
MSCSENHNEFYDKVLSDFGKNSYYIALEIRSDSYKGRAIIENNNLFNFMTQTKRLDKNSYETRMKKLLVHRRALKINNSDLLKWKFIPVKESARVYLNANKGVNSFVMNYFSGTVFKYDVNEDEMNAVINQLFYWNIPVRNDNVTGDLMLDN